MINPDAKTGKCTRRRATLETSKYEKKRGRAKKKVDAIHSGMEHTPSPSSSLGDGLDVRFPESPLHPAGPGYLTGPADYRQRANSSASSCGRLSPLAAWPYRQRLDSYQQEQLSDSIDGGLKFEAGVPLAYRGLNGYGMFGGGAAAGPGGPFSPGGLPGGLMAGPSGRPGEQAAEHFNGLQVRRRGGEVRLRGRFAGHGTGQNCRRAIGKIPKRTCSRDSSNIKLLPCMA